MKVVVAMSGGVDSSVVAGLLVEQGHDVIGVHMKLHDASPNSPAAGHCCGLDDALDARRVAETLGIPFYVMNLREAFQKAVMDDMSKTYLAGATPNPCIQCNGILKFRVLLSRAVGLGATHLATGHYARVVREEGKPVRLAAAIDHNKDQSYFLFPIPPVAMEKIMFPLGGMTKPEVRAHAERMNLITAEKAESQDVCFLPDGDHARFINEQHPDIDGSGDIVTEDGRVVGRHNGYFRYTVGQRRGLGVAFGKPAYVLRVEADTKRVVVSTDADRLLVKGLVAVRANWFDKPSAGQRVMIRIRHRSAPVPGTVVDPDDNGKVHLTFDEPARAVAPGQAAVLYEGDVVLGGAWIQKPVLMPALGDAQPTTSHALEA